MPFTDKTNFTLTKPNTESVFKANSGQLCKKKKRKIKHQYKYIKLENRQPVFQWSFCKYYFITQVANHRKL